MRMPTETAAEMRERLRSEMPGRWYAHPEYDALRRLERSEQLADVAAARRGTDPGTGTYDGATVTTVPAS